MVCRRPLVRVLALVFRHQAPLLLLVSVCAVLCACGGKKNEQIDRLNEEAYNWHYRNLDSAQTYARRALSLSGGKGDGAAEAINNLAFVRIARMQYTEAWKMLQQVPDLTDNQIEMLIADVQLMRLCQRESFNKDFYDYQERARRKLVRFQQEPYRLTPHQERRLLYAQTEFAIVASTYYYYVGLYTQAAKAVEDINPVGELEQDTAQYINYCYNIGAGGLITTGTKADIAQNEFDYLLRAYLLALRGNYVFWEAQALQAISEHLQKPTMRQMLVRNNMPALKYLNSDNMPDSLLAGNLALRALQMFTQYGDVYQIAGANRTLAECYWQIHDYRSAFICLQRALNIKAVHQAPDLVASIRERLCLVYSAVDDKANSDRNRNIYLDIQEQTRQDRMLEARASQLDASSRQLNIMLVAVVLMILIFIVSLFIFDAKRRRSDKAFSLNDLLLPLRQWQNANERQQQTMADKMEEIEDQLAVVKLHLQQDKRRNLDGRAKIQLVNSILPFIDRMVYVVRRMEQGGESEERKQQNFDYLTEITDSINDYNAVLTHWIQMRQGEVSLKIESFALQPLFDMVERGRMSFKMKGITLDVKPTRLAVKADKTLTLFMLNTIADNARKFTPDGGTVSVSATDTKDYVEVSVTDTGKGMDEETLAHIFDRTYTGGHGFGLKNCNGIIEKYKKMSRIFSVAAIGAESEVGQGTRIFFRLPHGVLRALTLLVCCVMSWVTAMGVGASKRGTATSKAASYADSAYYCNIQGRYQQALAFADSCRACLAPGDTATLLDVSNEAAVAALALHRWDVYEKNNTVYTTLFRQASADNSLPAYVQAMQRSESNKTVAVILLILLLITILPAYYFLYYRHRLDYQTCIDRIKEMNTILTSSLSDSEKLKGIEQLSDLSAFNLNDTQLYQLKTIVGMVNKALTESINGRNEQAVNIEYAEDNLKRLNMETAKLHVSNSVIDNCLSTLKHETMYYPSRIRQLIDSAPSQLSDIAELVDYYHDLYVILARQAMRQIPPIRLDGEMVGYLFDLLADVNGKQAPSLLTNAMEGGYVELQAKMGNCHYDGDTCRNLFTPYTPDLRFLLCRQIVREIGEATNLRACGIKAHPDEQGTIVVIVVPQKVTKYFPDTFQRMKAVAKQ